jgi:hypothetical protein
LSKIIEDKSGKHHGEPRQFGVKKCEANALVINPEARRRLVREAITRYVNVDAPADYEEPLEPERGQLRQALTRRFRR